MGSIVIVTSAPNIIFSTVCSIASRTCPIAKTQFDSDAEIISRADAAVALLKSVAGTDANLALVEFRIEIKKRLRALAKTKGIDASLRVSGLLRELRRGRLLPRRIDFALGDLIALGNRAAHGGAVEPQAAEWVFEQGLEVLASLDRILRAE